MLIKSLSIKLWTCPLAELLKAAKEHEEQCGKEKSELKSKLHQAELISQENLKPLQESLEVKEDAYRLV